MSETTPADRTPSDPAPRDPRQPADFNPLALGRELLRSARIGTLGTLDPQTGFPFTTLVNVATDIDGTPLILVSRLSTHTQNLLADQRLSLLLSKSGQNARAEKGDPMAHPRLTLQGIAELANDAAITPRLRRRFLARHPKAQLYVDFPDFAFFRLRPMTLHLNGGFARAFDGDAAAILSSVADDAAFDALEQGALAHLNTDHADALSLYAEKLCGKAAGAWRAAGLDPDGLDLMLGDEVARLAFPRRIEDGAALRLLLKELAEMARDARAPHPKDQERP
jgi:heme iron utilization protein